MKRNILFCMVALTTAAHASQLAMQETDNNSQSDQIIDDSNCQQTQFLINQKIIEQVRANGAAIEELAAGCSLHSFGCIMNQLSFQERKDFYRASFMEQHKLESEKLKLAHQQQWDSQKEPELQFLIKQNTYFGVVCPKETTEVQRELAAEGLY